jgi:hypothetical protein
MVVTGHGMDSKEERREQDGWKIGHSPAINYMQEIFISCGLETRFLGCVNVPMFMDCLSQWPLKLLSRIPDYITFDVT